MENRTIRGYRRKYISPKTRFEVFARDEFTCRYCGSKPPEVVLELDHVRPVSSGGSDDKSNLTTSCFSCNRGKGASTSLRTEGRAERIARRIAKTLSFDSEYLHGLRGIEQAAGPLISSTCPDGHDDQCGCFYVLLLEMIEERWIEWSPGAERYLDLFRCVPDWEREQKLRNCGNNKQQADAYLLARMSPREWQS